MDIINDISVIEAMIKVFLVLFLFFFWFYLLIIK